MGLEQAISILCALCRQVAKIATKQYPAGPRPLSSQAKNQVAHALAALGCKWPADSNQICPWFKGM